jgi:hypothetical protein
VIKEMKGKENALTNNGGLITQRGACVFVSSLPMWLHFIFLLVVSLLFVFLLVSSSPSPTCTPTYVHKKNNTNNICLVLVCLEKTSN